MGIKDAEVTDILRLVAGVLHIGNIQFVENGNYSQVADKSCKFLTNYFSQYLVNKMMNNWIICWIPQILTFLRFCFKSQ